MSGLALGMAALAVSAPVFGAEIGRWAGEHVLGTSFDVQLRGGGEGQATVSAMAALDEVRRLDCVLSTWREDSEISLLQREGERVVSPDLFAVLAECAAWRARTGGAFDVVRGLPPGEEGLRLDHRTRMVSLASGARLDIDALAKGYVIDRAFDAALRASPQTRALLLNIGGDMRAWTAPDTPAWRIAIADPKAPFENAAPLQTMALRTGGLAVSGAGHRSARAPIRDPRTGEIANVALAAASAPTAMQADALATSLAVLGAHDGRALVARLQGAAGLLIGAGGSAHSFGAWQTQSAQVCQAIANGNALKVSFEIPVHAGGNYERPYVAVWITDEARNHVRTLLILGPQPRWRETNYIFWRRVERMDASAVADIARPTRAPGRYEVLWDGLNEAGERAPSGRYMVNIEASREHGGHSFVSAPLDLGAEGVSITTEPSQELGQARIQYGPGS